MTEWLPIALGWVDIGLLGFLAISVLVGLLRGVVFEVLALAGWLVAYLSARSLGPIAAAQVPLTAEGSVLQGVVGFAAVFFGVLLLWGLGARLVRALIRATPLSLIDRVLGAGFGLLRGLAVLLVVAFGVGVSPLADSLAWQRSQGAVWLNAMLQELRPYLRDEPQQDLPAVRAAHRTEAS